MRSSKGNRKWPRSTCSGWDICGENGWEDSQGSIAPEASAIPSSLHPSGTDSLWCKSKKSRSVASRKNLRKTRYLRRSSRASSTAETWHLAKSSKRNDVSSSQNKVEDENYVPELPVQHVTNSHFCKVVNCQTYSLVNKSQRYNKKLAALTSKVR